MYTRAPKRKANKGLLNTDIDRPNRFNYKVYRLEKSKKIISYIPQVYAERAGNILYADIQYIKLTSYNSINYAIVITNDTTRYRFALSIPSIDKAATQIKQFYIIIYNNRGFYPKEIRLDRGRKFLKFTKQAQEKGIYIELSAPYIYKQNGVSEYSSFYLIQTA